MKETDAHTAQNHVYCTAVNPSGGTLEKRILVSVRQRQAITMATGLFTESHYTMSYRPNPILFSIQLLIYDVLVCIVKVSKKKTTRMTINPPPRINTTVAIKPESNT